MDVLVVLVVLELELVELPHQLVRGRDLGLLQLLVLQVLEYLLVLTDLLLLLLQLLLAHDRGVVCLAPGASLGHLEALHVVLEESWR